MLALVHIEKSAGKTVARIMRREYGPRHCDAVAWNEAPWLSAGDLRRIRWLHPGLASLAGHAVRPYGDLPEAFPKLRFYTMLRDPVVRCAAHYDYQIAAMGKTLSFEEWIQDERYRNRQTHYLAGRDDVDRALEVLTRKLFFVGLSERLDESMVLLKDRIGDPALSTSYPEYRVQPPFDRARRILENPAQRRLLEDANRSDQRLYETAQREIFPRQIAEFHGDFGAALEAFRAASGQGFEGWGWRRNLLRRGLVYKPAVALYRRLLPGRRHSPQSGGW